MKIYYKGEEYSDLTVDDNSFLYKAVMGTDTLTLSFSDAEKRNIPVGVYCDFLGQRYTLMQPMSIKKNNTKSYSYTLVMEGIQAELLKYKFKDPVDKTLKFIVTAKPERHLSMLVDSLNQHNDIWVAGECVDAVEGVISYNHNSCMEALNAMAQQFNTEWEVENMFNGTYKIHLRKVEYNKADPLILSYGKGKGFLSGLNRITESANQIEVLYVQGGEQNIDYYEYGSKYLGLPKSKYLAYDGKTFYNNYNATNKPPKELNCNVYVTDDKGECIKRADKVMESGVEASLDCSHIYPKGGGKVESVTYENANDPNAINCNFVGKDDIVSGLDYSKLIAQGDNLRIIFQEGMLVGKEFDVAYDHASRTFKVIPQEIDGQRMPNQTFTPKVGERYIVLGIAMPKGYICNDSERSGASWEMFREGVKYLYANERPRFSYRGNLDGIWAKRSWNNINHKIKLGGYIKLEDKELTEDENYDVLIRMTGIRQSVNNPYSPELEFSNVTATGGVSSMLKVVKSNEVIAEAGDRKVFNFTKRRFKDALETQALLKDSLLDFSSPANPITVHTMSALVGDESLQFRFVEFVTQRTTGLNGVDTDATISRQVPYHIEYERGDQVGTGTLKIPGGYIQHMTLDVDKDIQGPSAYKYWRLSAALYNVTKNDKRHYLYARVSKTGNVPDISNPAGAWNNYVFSEKAIGLNAEAGYYHLLVGVLNSDEEGDRSYVSLFGFSELLPGRLTTGRIVSSDGQTYFDLDSGTIGGKIVFEERNNKHITLIEGGKINANCINTEKLRASEIVTAKAGNRIEINTEGSPSAICIFGSGAPGAPGLPGSPGAPGAVNAEKPTLIVDGKNISELNEFTNPQSLPANVPILSSACTYSKTYNDQNRPKGSMDDATLYLTSQSGFHIASDQSGRLITNIPALTVKVDATGEGNSASNTSLCSRGGIDVRVLLDGEILGEGGYDFIGRVSGQTFTIPARSSKLTAGNHSLTVEIGGRYDILPRYPGGAIAPNPPAVGLSVSVNVTVTPNPSAISFNIVDKLTHLFANGFGSRYDTNKYFCVFNKQDNTTPLVNVRGQQSYLSPDGYSGLTVTNDGVFCKKRVTNAPTSVMGAVPSIVCMGVVNSNASFARRWAATGVGLGVSAVAGTPGRYLVTISNTGFGNAGDYFVSVTSNGTGSLYVLNQSATSFNVYSHNNAATAFSFCVYNVNGMLK